MKFCSNRRAIDGVKALLTDPPPGASFPHLSPTSDLSSFSLTAIDAHRTLLFHHHEHKHTNSPCSVCVSVTHTFSNPHYGLHPNQFHNVTKIWGKSNRAMGKYVRKNIYILWMKAAVSSMQTIPLFLTICISDDCWKQS